MDRIIMVSDVAWIPRGVAKTRPDKIKLDDEDMKKLIEGAMADTSDVDDSEDDEAKDIKEEMGEMELDTAEASNETKPKKAGLRGSMKEEEMDEEDGDKTVEDKYMKDFDKEDEQERGMRGISMYSSNKDDPYVTEHVDSDAEEEKEEFEIKEDDNLVAVAKIEKDEYTMEVYVYNEANGDWYCHHDYILDAPPLCLEPIQHDPGNEKDMKGNLMAVGTMESVINIWDLDIMNAVEPVVTLGTKTKVGRRKKRDGSEQGHTDAVISMAWNKHTTHVLASGGADKQVILWDLDEAKAAQAIPERGGEVQALAWHPNEASFILAGTMKGAVQVLDCRLTDGSTAAAWKFGGQVEKVKWNHFNPFYAFVASDDGMLRHIDMRKPGEIVWEGRAHEESIGGLSLSARTRGLLTTVGQDQLLCVWKVGEDGLLSKIHSEKLHIGPLHAAVFNPDVATVCVVGGSEDDLVRVVDLAKYEPVVQAFS